MKIKTALIAFVIISLGACTQRTCPTYAQNDAPQIEESVEKV